MQSRTFRSLRNATSALLLSGLAAAQDVDVLGNLTMPDSTATQGNILKGGVPFIHNFGPMNTFLGSFAGNLTMSGSGNTGIGFYSLYGLASGSYNVGCGSGTLSENTTGVNNAAIGFGALGHNATGSWNTAAGSYALFNNFNSIANTATGGGALFENTNGSWNTATGNNALRFNATGTWNTATGVGALGNSNTGANNTAVGVYALLENRSGSFNTAIGSSAGVALRDLTNATAIGANAIVDASNKIRLGDTNVTVIEGQVPFSFSSDFNQKEGFLPVDGEQVLTKLRDLSLTSWNYIGHDPQRFRHYGPVAQDFFTAFGDDGVGAIGSPTTINSGDMAGVTLIATQALEKRTAEQREQMAALLAENADLKRRLEALERLVKSAQKE